MNKKKILFQNPLHIKQKVKVSDGDITTLWKWDVPQDLVFLFWRIYRFFLKLLPYRATKEVGAVYATIREGYYWIGESGELERREVPEVGEDEELCVETLLYMECDEPRTITGQSGAVIELKSK